MYPPDALLRFRPEFPILERKTYLVSHSLGAMPRSVETRMQDYVAIWASEGVGAWEKEWWDLPIRTGDEIAPLMGASDGEVAMMPNVSLAQATVLSSIPFSSTRDKIVMTALDFPSVRYVYDSLAPRFGARIEVIPSDDGISIAEQRIIDAIDDRTALVAISHVLFRSAYIMDVAAICAKAKKVGARVSLDSFHAVGTLPLDVHAIGADFMSGGVLKWLCGGPGGCFLYVSSSARAQLKPSITGWQAHAKPFDFAGEMDYADGIWGWLSGTPSIPALYAASEGPKILRQAGINAIRAKSLRQTARLIEMADRRGFRVNSPKDGARRGGTVSIEPPNAIDVYRHLLSHDVMVDYRPGAGLRIAPHFYTSDAELDRVMDEIDPRSLLQRLHHTLVASRQPPDRSNRGYCRPHEEMKQMAAKKSRVPKKVRKQYKNNSHPLVVLRFEDGHEIKIYRGLGKAFDAWSGETVKVLAINDPTSSDVELLASQKSDAFDDAD